MKLKIMGMIYALAILIAGGTVLPAQDKLVKIGVIRVPAPFAVEQEEGFLDEMRRLGYVEGKNVHYVSRVVGANVEDFPKTAALARKMITDEGLQLLATMGTQASQPVWPAIKDMGVPMVFSGVTFPIDAELIKDYDVPTGQNVTGISYGISPKTRLALLRKMFPDTKKYRRLAFAYCGTIPQEILYSKYLKELKSDETSGWQLEFIDLYDYAKKQPDLAYLTQKVKEKNPDIIIGWFTLDQFSANAESFYQFVKTCNKPIVAITSLAVDNGAIGGILTDHKALGVEQANMVHRILKGEKASTIPAEQAKAFLFELNIKQAVRLGITFPIDIVNTAARTITK